MKIGNRTSIQAISTEWPTFTVVDIGWSMGEEGTTGEPLIMFRFVVLGFGFAVLYITQENDDGLNHWNNR